MSRIVLVRPGSTDFDTQGRIQGTLDIPLSEEGKSQIHKLEQELKSLGISTIYTSCCQAAGETADLLGEALSLKVKKLDKMQNLDHGLWQGMLVEDVKRKQPKVYRQWQEQPEIICPPEGEMVSDAQERIEAALHKILKKHKDEVVAVVMPEPLASLIRSHLLHAEVAGLWKEQSVCGSWEVFDVNARGEVEAPAAVIDKLPTENHRKLSIKAG